MDRVMVGIIGCGTISGAYFQGLRDYEILDVVACADLMLERAEAKAEEYGVPRSGSVASLLADPEIEVVVNLTVPKVHAEVNRLVIESGKSVHCEKPLATQREDGRLTVELAADREVRVGCAPDTFLGGGIQTCRKLVDDGAIGEPVAASAFMAGHGHEGWHPAPDFYYQEGGGPMFDMGPYYITALVNLLGPVRRVTGSTRISFPERVITADIDRKGERIPVETPTHLSASIDFESGVIATMVMSFDIWAHRLPRIEIYGSEGSLSVPDPNTFGGPVQIRKANAGEWTDVALTHSDQVRRGIGVSDLAYGLRSGRPHRASGELAMHVLDVMASVDEASTESRHIDIATTCLRPAPLPMGLEVGTLDP